MSMKTWGGEAAKKEKRVTDSNSQSNLHIGPSQCETRDLQPYPEHVIGRFYSFSQAVYCNVALISSKFVFLNDSKHSCYSIGCVGVFSFQSYPTTS